MKLIRTENLPISLNYLKPGEIYFGNEPVKTTLGSCVSIIMYSERESLAAVSHIVGHKNHSEYSLSYEVLDKFEELFEQHYKVNPEYYVLGGVDNLKYIFYKTLDELVRRNKEFNVLDSLGDMHRTIIVCPQNAEILMRKYESIIKK